MFIKRKLLSIIEKYLDKPEALVITGFRRVGKSTLIKYIFDNLKTDNKIFLDLESPVNQKIFKKENYEAIITEFKSLGLRLEKEKAFVFLDEIQYLKNIPSIVKYLFDHYRIKFIMTGSSSFYLKNLFTESLAGRKFIFELYPLDFEEFLWFRGEKLSVKADYHFLRHFYDEYMEFGGLPGVVLEKNKNDKNLRLDEVLGSYFNIDVVSLSSFRQLKNLKSLLFLLASRAGNRLDVGKLSQVMGVSRQTVYNYLEFFEKTYLISLIPVYSKSTEVTKRKIPKLYFHDSGILNRIGKVSAGQLFENTVFHQLFIKSYFNDPSSILSMPPLFYFYKKTGVEIDFIFKNIAYEVKLTATISDFARLKRISQKVKLDDCYLVSLEESREREGVIYPFEI